MSKALANLKVVNRSSMYAMCEALCDAAIEILERLDVSKPVCECTAPMMNEDQVCVHCWRVHVEARLNANKGNQ